MKVHSIRKLLGCLALLTAVGGFDYLTGYEVSSYPMYLLPIFLTFFYFGRFGAYLASVISIVMWTLIDIGNGHQFTHEILRYWNALSRLVVYFLFVYGLSLYFETVAASRHRLEAMRRLISICHGCGKVLWKDGTWRSAEEVLELTDGEVPECPGCKKSDVLATEQL